MRIDQTVTRNISTGWIYIEMRCFFEGEGREGVGEWRFRIQILSLFDNPRCTYLTSRFT